MGDAPFDLVDAMGLNDRGEADKGHVDALDSADPDDLVALAYSILKEHTHYDVDVAHSFQSAKISGPQATALLTDALATMKTKRSYGRKALLTIHWENDDVNAVADTHKMANLMRDVFGFEVEIFTVPMRGAENLLRGLISMFVGRHDEEDDQKPPSLLMFHFAGHGMIRKGHQLYIAGTESSKKWVSFSPLRSAMLASKGDVLMMMDCCCAAAMVRSKPDPSRTVEAIAAGGESEETYSNDSSFTHYIDMAARHLGSKGPFTIESLIRSLDIVAEKPSKKRKTRDFESPASSPLKNESDQPYHTVPFHRRISGTVPIKLHPKSKSNSEVTLPPSSEFDGEPVEGFIAFLVHLVTDPSSQATDDFLTALEALSARPGFNARVVFKYRTSSSIVVIALPSPIAECLKPHPAILRLGQILPDELWVENIASVHSPSSGNTNIHHVDSTFLADPIGPVSSSLIQRKEKPANETRWTAAEDEALLQLRDTN